MEHIPQDASPIGYLWLVKNYNLACIPHFRWSYIVKHGARRTLKVATPIIFLYDEGYSLDKSENPIENLIFALKHEGINLEIITAFFKCISKEAIQKYIATKPSGKYQRILWYLYEKITKIKLDIPDLKNGTYYDLLNAKKYYTSKAIPQRRYRINDNLLGNIKFCPFVRKTDFLKIVETKKLDAVALKIIKSFDAEVLDRATNYLYAQETMSSYQIEREIPSKKRLARFIQIIKKTETIPTLTDKTLINLQNSIVDERFINTGFRTNQNYIGQSRDWYNQIIHYISPKPEDVNELMQNLLATLQRMIESGVHPIITAAVISFGFVFIHPFDDGNGRLHRFLIHYILHKTGFTPSGLIFPISAIILSDMRDYNTTLETFSKPLMELITDYEIDDKGVISVNQNTSMFYRYIDYTNQAEYLASCIEKTIHTDFKKELIYLTNYDKTKKELTQIVDMPDQLFDLFIKLTTQNNGQLSQNKRSTLFKMLTDEEIKGMEDVVKNIMLAKLPTNALD